MIDSFFLDIYSNIFGIWQKKSGHLQILLVIIFLIFFFQKIKIKISEGVTVSFVAFLLFFLSLYLQFNRTLGVYSYPVYCLYERNISFYHACTVIDISFGIADSKVIDSYIAKSRRCGFYKNVPSYTSIC